jgi:hypothetical protein
MSKTVWVVQEVWSDGEEDNLSHFSSKSEAVTGFKEAVENIEEQWSDCDEFEMYSNDNTQFHGQDNCVLKTTVMQFSEHEVTVYLKEMPVKKKKRKKAIPAGRFFSTKKMEKKVKLTKEEEEEIENLEYSVYKHQGLDYVNGAYLNFTIVDTWTIEDEDECCDGDEIGDIILEIATECGVQDGEDNSLHLSELYYNRTKKKLREE